MPDEAFAEVAVRNIRITNTTRLRLVTVIAVFRAHEDIGIFPQFFTDRGVLLHIGLQCRVVLQKLLVVDERWVLTNLIGDFAVAVEELVEAPQLPARDVAVPVTLVLIPVHASAVGVLVAVIAVFRAHERIGIFPQFFTDRGVLLHIGLQCRVVLQKLLVVDERWVLTNLIGDFAVAVEELVEAPQLPARDVAVPVTLVLIPVHASAVGILVAVIAVFRAHEGIGIFPQFFTDRGVLLHIGLQCRMVLQKLLVVDERWVLTNLIGDFAVAVEELVEAPQLPARDVAVPVTLVLIPVHASAVGILVAVIAVFRAHEGIGIFPQFFTDRGVLLHIGLQCRVVLQKLLVVDERWVLTNLIGDFAVAVEELVEAPQLPARDVAVPVTLVLIPVHASAVGILVVVIAVFRAHEGIGIFPQFFTDRGVLLHIGLQCRMVLQKLLVVDERWVLTNLIGDFAVAVEELVEAPQLPPRDVAVPVTLVLIPVHASAVGILVAVIAVFRAHEGIGIFPQFFTDRGVLLHIGLQCRMVLQKLLVVDERWVLTNLIGDFAVAVEELVEVRQLPARNVAILIRLFIVIARGRALHGRGLRPCGDSEPEKHRQA